MARVNLAKTSPSSFRRRVFSVPPPGKKCCCAELPKGKPRSASEGKASTNYSSLAKSGGTTLPNISSPQAPASPPNKSEAKRSKRGLGTAFEIASQEITLGNDTSNFASTDVAAPPFAFPKRRLSMTLRKAENLLREQEESFELHERYLTASAELRKCGLCWQPTELKRRASRVQRKIRKLEAMEVQLAALAKDERAMLVG